MNSKRADETTKDTKDTKWPARLNAELPIKCVNIQLLTGSSYSVYFAYFVV